MNELKFNIYGFTNPQTRAEYISLLDETLRMADDLAQQLHTITALAAENSVA